MKVGAKVDIFNCRMRERRAEFGLTLRALHELSGLNINDIQDIEKLRCVRGRIRDVQDKLSSVASALEIGFDELFPQDYLDMLAEKKLPKRRRPFIWCKEISLEQLGSVEPGLLLPSAEDLVLDDANRNGLKEQVKGLLGELSEQEQRVIVMRFGIDDDIERTYEYIAQSFCVTRERIRQIEAKALRKLRHPYRSIKIREFVI